MDQQYINDFKIAELNIRITFKESQRNSMRLLPSFEPFRAEIDSNDIFFQLTVDDTLKPFPKERRERISAAVP